MPAKFWDFYYHPTNKSISIRISNGKRPGISKVTRSWKTLKYNWSMNVTGGHWTGWLLYTRGDEGHVSGGRMSYLPSASTGQLPMVCTPPQKAAVAAATTTVVVLFALSFIVSTTAKFYFYTTAADTDVAVIQLIFSVMYYSNGNASSPPTLMTALNRPGTLSLPTSDKTDSEFCHVEGRRRRRRRKRRTRSVSCSQSVMDSEFLSFFCIILEKN